MSTSSSDDLDIPALSIELRERYGASLAYQALWRAVVDGLVPARRVGRVWRIKRVDVPAIASNLGLSQPPSVA